MQTLKDYATTKAVASTALGADFVCSVGVQVLQALDFVEANQIVHMDVRAENVLIEMHQAKTGGGHGKQIEEDEVTVKLCGFGAAVRCSRPEDTGSLVWHPPETNSTLPGIRAVHSPEVVVMALQQTASVELTHLHAFSAGVLLYRLLKHSHPYGEGYPEGFGPSRILTLHSAVQTLHKARVVLLFLV